MTQVPCPNDFGQAGIPVGTTMFYAYVIKSRKFAFLYKGHCENLSLRIDQHNAGKTKSIKAFIPLDLIYFEEFGTREDAVKREKYFKSAAGRRLLMAKLADVGNKQPSTFDTGSLPE